MLHVALESNLRSGACMQRFFGFDCWWCLGFLVAHHGAWLLDKYLARGCMQVCLLAKNGCQHGVTATKPDCHRLMSTSPNPTSGHNDEVSLAPRVKWLGKIVSWWVCLSSYCGLMNKWNHLTKLMAKNRPWSQTIKASTSKYPWLSQRALQSKLYPFLFWNDTPVICESGLTIYI